MQEVKRIAIREEIFADNRVEAKKLQGRLALDKVFMINVMASPGSGKTSFIIETLRRRPLLWHCGVIEADIDSDVDAQKVQHLDGIKTVQLNTGGFCHLDAQMVQTGLQALSLADLDLIFIENIGNLVCPAEFETGAHLDLMLLSIPEGDDKPLKYPLMFSKVQVVVINKIDYLSMSDFNVTLFKERVLKLNPKAVFFELSCRTGEGFQPWLDWLEHKVSSFLNRGWQGKG